jgi:hypothetical protein
MPLRLEYAPDAISEFADIPPSCRAAVLEHLSRFASDWESVRRHTAPPLAPGMRTGIWCWHPDQTATLVQFTFTMTSVNDRAVILRVHVSNEERVPPWVTNPSEWYQDQPPFPVVDIEG